MQSLQSGSRARSLRSTLTAAFVALSVIGVGSFAAVGCGGGGGGGGGGGTFNGNAVSASKSTVAAVSSGSTAPADGTTPITITVTLKDSNGNPIQNAVVVASASGTDTFFTTSGLSSSTGVITVTVTSTKAQTETITVTAFQNGVQVGTPLTQTVSVTFTQVLATTTNTSSITASPTSLVADGTTTSTITATVVDANGVAVNGASVVFTANSGSVSVTPTTAVLTNSSGQASATVTSKTAQTGVTISAAVTFPGATGTTLTLTSPAITFVSGPATGIAIITTGLTATAGVPFTLQAQVLDANGNAAASNAEVTLSLLNDCVAGTQPFQQTNVPNGLPIGQNGSPLSTVNTIAVANGSGLVTFPGLVLKVAGAYKTAAFVTINGSSVASSAATFSVVGNVATGLAFKFNEQSAFPTNTGNIGNVQVNQTLNVTVSATDVFGNATTSLPPGDGTGSSATSSPTGVSATGHYITLTPNAVSGSITTSPATLPITLLTNGQAKFSFTFTGTVGAVYNFTAKDNTVTNTATGVASLGTSASSRAFSILTAAPAAGSAATVAVVSHTAPTNTVTPFNIVFGFNDSKALGSAKTLTGATATIAFYNGCEFATFKLNGAAAATSAALDISAAGASGTTVSPSSIQIENAGTWTLIIYNASDNTGAYDLAGGTAGPFVVAPGPINSLTFVQRGCDGVEGFFPVNATSNVGVPITVQAVDLFNNNTTDLTGAGAALTVTSTAAGFAPTTSTLVNGAASFTLTTTAATSGPVTVTTTGFTPTTGASPSVNFVAPASVGTPFKLVLLNQPRAVVVAGDEISNLGVNGAGLPANAGVSGVGVVTGVSSNNEFTFQIQDNTGVGVSGVTTTLAFAVSHGIGNQGDTSTWAGTAVFDNDTNSLVSDAQGLIHIQGNFENLSVVGMRIKVSSTTLNGLCMNLVDIVPGPFDGNGSGSLGFIENMVPKATASVPVGAVAGTSSVIGPPDASGDGIPVIAAFDSYGNVSTQVTGNVSASQSYAVLPAAGVLSGTLNVNLVSGIAVFNNLFFTAGTSGSTITPQIVFDFNNIAGGASTTPVAANQISVNIK